MHSNGAVCWWSVLMQEPFLSAGRGVIQLTCGRLRDKCPTLMIVIVKNSDLLERGVEKVKVLRNTLSFRKKLGLVFE